MEIDKRKIPSNVKSCKLVEIIEIVISKGTGSDEDPVRLFTQYWTREGILLFEIGKVII